MPRSVAAKERWCGPSPSARRRVTALICDGIFPCPVLSLRSSSGILGTALCPALSHACLTYYISYSHFTDYKTEAQRGEEHA